MGGQGTEGVRNRGTRGVRGKGEGDYGGTEGGGVGCAVPAGCLFPALPAAGGGVKMGRLGWQGAGRVTKSVPIGTVTLILVCGNDLRESLDAFLALTLKLGCDVSYHNVPQQLEEDSVKQR